MTTYRSRVRLPDTLSDFITAFTGPGAFKLLDGDLATFTFDAEDLWEAAQIVHGVQQATSQMFTQPTVIDKPVEYVEPDKFSTPPKDWPLKPWPEPWPATELDAIIDRLEEIIDIAEGDGQTAISHKIDESIGALDSARTASRQYADGTLEPK